MLLLRPNPDSVQKVLAFLTFLHNLNIGHLKFKIYIRRTKFVKFDTRRVRDARMTLKGVVTVHLPLPAGPL